MDLKTWKYAGQVTNVVDGDTVDIDLLLGELALGPITTGIEGDPSLRPAAGAAIDLGFHLVLGLSEGKARLVGRFRFRLLGYNAPETHGIERSMGLIASGAAQAYLPIETRVQVETFKGDAFGRWLARVRLPDGRDLVGALLERGFGVAWDGKGDRPRFDPTRPYPLAMPMP